MLVSITKGKVGNLLWYSILFLHLALVPIYLGIWSVLPSYVQVFSNWIHLVVGLYLVVRFRPFQSKIDLYAHDTKLVFSAGIFMLQALLASSLLESPWGDVISVYLSQWKDKVTSWILSMDKKVVKKSPKYSIAPSSSSSDVMEPNPNDTVSTLGNSVYASE